MQSCLEPFHDHKSRYLNKEAFDISKPVIHHFHMHSKTMCKYDTHT